MSISLLVLALLPLFASSLLTHQIYSLAYHWQNSQIAADNAGIVIGQSDRRALRELHQANRKLGLLEVRHHLVHHCARVPDPVPACLSADLALETEIDAVRTEAYWKAWVIWRRGEWDARTQLSQFGVVGQIVHLSQPPVLAKRCPLCGKEVLWELVSRGVETRITTDAALELGVSVRILSKSLTALAEPDYRLESWNKEKRG